VYYGLGLGTPHLVIWVTLLNGLMGVTWAFISTASTLFLVRVVGRSKRGQALGLYNAVAGAGGLFGTLLGGFLFATYGFSAAYTVAAVTVLGGAVLLLPIPFHVFLAPQVARHRSPLKGARATTPPGFPLRPPPRDLTSVLDGHQR
jgi:MFS family permease